MTRSHFLTRALSAIFGVAMVAIAEPHPHRPVLWLQLLALAAVGCGVRFLSAATLAVLLTAVTLVLSVPPPMLDASSGLCATSYLVMRHVSGSNSAVPTKVTVLAALSFGLAGAVVMLIPLNVPWLPLIAPFGLLAASALVLHPYLRHPYQG